MKKIILVGMCIFLCGILFTEEALWVTAEDTPAWKEDGKYIRSYIHNITKTFPKDTKVILDDNIYIGSVTDKDGCIESVQYDYMYFATVGDEKYEVEAKNIVPIDTPDLFDESFLTVAHYPSSYLLPSYFADVLKSGTRSTMRKYEKDFIEKLGDGNEYDDPWWEYSVEDESVITQSFLRISLGGKFLIKRIEKIPNGYKIDVKRTEYPYEDIFFPPDRLEYPLFFQFDGDYVDIYVDNLSNKVLSLTYVSPEFYEGVKMVISDDVPVDLSNLIFPRRENGSSDYDDEIIPRQELPQIYRDPLQDTSIVIDETTTLDELKKTITENASINLLNNEDRDGKTSLMTAIAYNPNIEIIKLLIESGADTKKELLNAAYYSDNIELYKLLIEADADISINEKYYYSGTPLNTAVQKNRSFEIIKLLLESGADINEKNNHGDTSLMYAVDNGNHEIVKFLIEANADVNAKNNLDRTPLMNAILRSRGMKTYNNSLEIIKLLLESGADTSINERDNNGHTSLTWVSRSFLIPEIMAILINAGASISIVSENPLRDDDPHFLEILEDLKKMGWKENSDDKIIWQERGKTYLTTDNLRLRATEGVSGNPLFTLPKDTPVQVNEIGNIEKIDDIFAYWVEVAVAEDTIDTEGKEVKKGAVGWCFGGYVTNEGVLHNP